MAENAISNLGENDIAIVGMAAHLPGAADIAAYYATQKVKPGTADESVVAVGERIYRGGNAPAGVPACMACHGPSGRGNPGAGYPSLGGQHAQYSQSQLEQFRSMQRANDAGQMMRNIAIEMTDPDIQAVSSYIEGLRPD